MPQPLSRVKPGAGYNIGNVGIGDSPLVKRPQLALLAMEGIRSWSDVENFMLGLYIDMLGGDNDLAATAYLALDGSSAKSAVINAVAAKTLSTENLQLFRAIFNIAGTRQKARDKLAHWVWGFSDALPDALLLVDPRAKVGGKMSEEDIFVYREADFRSIMQDNERLAAFGATFRFIVIKHVSNKQGELYAQLCAEPPIAERLLRLQNPKA